ncbi:hypothetical protein EJ02DRAFT_56779 [Clathrospora elynae]|uniref:Uncharacterized protein n=1 Tax=Clathrospora elynae TaxID=706981 RepID=A0A6A5SCQ1_9PLEO|nr:hypothetical protein EJ02DRAFT_56779 [Clathrospora elynae]
MEMAQTSPFLTLPGEIRNYIVEYVFRREAGTAPPPLSRSPLALAFTCRQLHREFQNLARSATIFTIRWSSSQELGSKASILPPASISSTKKLQIQLPPDLVDLYIDDAHRKRVKSFGFSDAGLIGLEELYFRYRPEHHEKGVGGPGREFLVLALWRILWERGNENLKKVCVVHDGTQPYLSLTLLHGMLEAFGPCRRSKRWQLKSDMEHGQLLFVEQGQNSQPQRQIAIALGYSFREAEEYVAVCEQIFEGKEAEVLLARRQDCEYVSSLLDLSDAALRREFDNLKTLFPVYGDELSDLQSRVQAIRSMSNASIDA